jgi:hypothetical protein
MWKRFHHKSRRATRYVGVGGRGVDVPCEERLCAVGGKFDEGENPSLWNFSQ